MCLPTLLDLGHTNEAVQEFREVLRLNPHDQEAQRALNELRAKSAGL